MEHGYSETKIQNETALYWREHFRYKTNKNSKKEMDLLLLNNLTVSRINPYSLSVTK